MLLGLLALHGAVRAQGENNHWCFGYQGGGLSFTPAGPVARSSGSVLGSEAHATVSDAWGNLLFYTDGQTIFDQRHQPMPGSCPTCGPQPFRQLGHASALQGSLIVQRPGTARSYYLFTTDALENQYANGLRYSEIDLGLRGGLGAVTATQNVRLPTPTLSSRAGEGVAGVQHANRRDVWVVAHAEQSDELYAFLVTPAGVASVPVVSHWNVVGLGGAMLQFAPHGRQAAISIGLNKLTLLDFDAATGRFSNPVRLDTTAAVPGNAAYGLAYSPDGSKLYQYTQFEGLTQYDLQAGSAAAIRRSRVSIAPRDNARCLAPGPDGRLYTAWRGISSVGVIERPNERGLACQYQYTNISGNGTQSLQNLVQPLPPLVDFAPPPACAGTPVAFQPATPLPPGSSDVTWTFATATGGRDSVLGPSVAHIFAQPGQYQVTLSFTISGHPYHWVRLVTVAPAPTLHLSLRRATLCPGAQLQLRARVQPAGTPLRWSNGSTDSTLTVTAPGRYWVEARNAQGCTRADTALVEDAGCLVPNVITPNGDPLNETFRLRGFRPADWTLEVYNRWGRQVYRMQGYDNAWNAAGQPAGVYYYLLTQPATGQRIRGYVEVVR